jgi:DNA-directed RNA polymerase subunit F
VKVFKEEEVEYMINLIRYSTKDFSNLDLLKPLFNKALNTLEKVMEEMMLGNMFDKICVKIIDISPENTLKILIRCKMMLQSRK